MIHNNSQRTADAMKRRGGESDQVCPQSICATETVLFTVTEITAKVRIFPAVIWLPSPPSTLLISGGGRRRSCLVRRGANDATSVGRRDKAPGDDVCAALTDSDRRPLVGGADSVRVSGGRGEENVCFFVFLQTPAERCCVKVRQRRCIFFFFRRVCVESIYNLAEI